MRKDFLKNKYMINYILNIIFGVIISIIMFFGILYISMCDEISFKDFLAGILNNFKE